ncbi:MAG TPA: hypothetical protein VHZ54_00780 [Solirubrobacterales bacterium]|jgi:hypothetical protein|nr:hypothetical protein [Solirubrobacterales bacterium]
MKVDYDSEGHSLLFEFGEFHHFEKGDYVELLADDQCIVGIHDGRVDHIQLLGADEDITPLDEAAERFELDADGLRAGARAALAVPDREVLIDVRDRLPLGSEGDSAEAA